MKLNFLIRFNNKIEYNWMDFTNIFLFKEKLISYLVNSFEKIRFSAKLLILSFNFSVSCNNKNASFYWCWTLLLLCAVIFLVSHTKKVKILTIIYHRFSRIFSESMYFTWINSSLNSFGMSFSLIWTNVSIISIVLQMVWFFWTMPLFSEYKWIRIDGRSFRQKKNIPLWWFYGFDFEIQNIRCYIGCY